MAGGKETPRQKMIGMMYLVLTALLALQVSNAVLEKFAIIYETLEELSSAARAKNAIVLQTLVDEKGQSPEPKIVKALENARQVRDLTQTTLKNIEDLKLKMKDLSGTREIDEKLINDHSSKVATMMISQPEGKAFEKLLEDYVAKLRQLSGLTEKELPKLAKPPREIEVFASDEDHVNKDFLTFTFENTPVIAALASVTQMETEILAFETKALDKLRADAGAGDVKFDKMVPMVRSKEAIVAAGATYEADLFISASSTAFKPEMFMNGNKLEIFEENGIKMGKVKFVAAGGDYDAAGFTTKSYKAEIKLPEQTLEKVVEYKVARPTIKVTTGNAPTLYMNCGNNVTIEVPQLGSSYNPSFSARGAEIRKGAQPGKVTIIPSERKISVSVSNGGMLIGSQPFDVRTIPLPRYVIKDNTGKEVDKKAGVRGAGLTSLRCVPEPDPNFKTEVPQDAVYRVRSMEVIHARGTSPVNRTTVTNENIDLAAWRPQFRPGDQIVIEVKTVTRRTFKGDDERVEVKNEVYSIPLK